MSLRGKIKTQYRRRYFWPRDPSERALDAAISSLPAPAAMRAVAKLCGVRTNVRAKL